MDVAAEAFGSMYVWWRRLLILILKTHIFIRAHKLVYLEFSLVLCLQRLAVNY